MLDYLAIYSEAIRVPEVKSLSLVSGMEHRDGYSLFIISQEDGFQYIEGLSRRGILPEWHISSEDLDQYRNLGMDLLSEIVSMPNRSEFQESILSSIRLYSRAAFTDDPLDKLVYVLSALESLLLNGESEPIQSSLSERMAFLLFTNGEQRRNLITTVKSVYRMRSRYLHHGKNSAELEILETFLKHVNVFFITVVKVAHRHASKTDFVRAIDDIKFGV